MSKQHKKIMGVKVLAAVMLMSAGAFQGARAQSVSGTVTGPDGYTPLQGIRVTVYTPDETGFFWNYCSSTITELDGSYELPVRSGAVSRSSLGLLEAPGLSCRVKFSDPSHVFASEVYNNVAHILLGTTLQVGVEESVSDINASLVLASTLSGTVTGPGGLSPLSDIWVAVYIWNGEWLAVSEAITDADGVYEIGDLFPGTYRIEFRDWDGYYASEVYNDTANLDLGADLVLTAGSATNGINASLAQGAQIRGNITRSGGTTPLHGIAAEAFQKEGGAWRSKGTATSDSGAYAITGLPAGTYRVVFSDWNLYYVGEVYDNVYDIEAGVDIVVAAGATVDGINAALDQMPTLAGRVTGPDGSTPVSGIQVTPYRWEAGVWVEQSWCTDISATDGTYLLERLNPGTFRIGFHDGAGRYLDGFWSGAQSVETATDVAVAGGAAITGITNALFAASYITGTAYSPAFDGVPDIQVSAYSWNVQSSSWDLISYTFTDADGSYEINGLRAGTYRVEFHDWGVTYADQVYDGMADLQSGTDVAVGAGSTVTYIDAWLSPPPPSTPSVIVGLLLGDESGYDVLFTGDVGSDYVLQETTDLTLESDDWEDYGYSATCQPGTNSLPFSPTEPVGFLRLRWLP